MSIFELFLTACGLSMDAFAVSVTNGLCVRKGRVMGALMCGIIFGLFQGIMPAIGYALGMNFAEYIERFDHWIALILLGFIGLNMICGSGEDEIQTVQITAERVTVSAVPFCPAAACREASYLIKTAGIPCFSNQFYVA